MILRYVQVPQADCNHTQVFFVINPCIFENLNVLVRANLFEKSIKA